MNKNRANKIPIWNELPKPVVRISVLIEEIFSRWVQNDFYSSGQNINKQEKLKETLYIKVFEK